MRWPAALTVGGIALTVTPVGIGFVIAGFIGVLLGCAAVSALATVAVWLAWESGAVAGVPADLITATAPGAFLVRDRRVFWAMSAAMGLGWLPCAHGSGGRCSNHRIPRRLVAVEVSRSYGWV